MKSHGLHNGATTVPKLNFTQYSPYAAPFHPQEKPANKFFSSKLSVNELKGLAYEVPAGGLQKNFDFNFGRFQSWATGGGRSPPVPVKLLPKPVASSSDIVAPPPPGLPTGSNWSVAKTSTTSNFTPTASRFSLPTTNTFPSIQLSTEVVTLNNPPKKSLVKRQDRGTFSEEEVCGQRYVGKLKFYQLKKRFGFITLEDEEIEDIFLCEDDLLLSGVPHKNFKENLINQVEMKFEFRIKTYSENGKTKRKAIDIIVIS